MAVLSPYLNIVQILVSIALITVIFLQGKQGALGGLLSGDSSVYRTKRGLEKTLYRLTIVLTVTFVIVSVLNVLI